LNKCTRNELVEVLVENFERGSLESALCVRLSYR